ncbi:hypothetical protein Avbf_06794 [Armadillidium vulgare]|nr:hypothetical protein Avbf_06794 [Armadillidium vulgare]
MIKYLLVKKEMVSNQNNNLELDIMAEGNEGRGEATVQQVEDSERTEDYQKLIDYGLNEKVAVKLDEIYHRESLSMR